jgi:hypothetical protein
VDLFVCPRGEFWLGVSYLRGAVLGLDCGCWDSSARGCFVEFVGKFGTKFACSLGVCPQFCSKQKLRFWSCENCN